MQMQILHGLTRTLEKMPSYRCHLARSSKLGRCAADPDKKNSLNL